MRKVSARRPSAGGSDRRPVCRVIVRLVDAADLQSPRPVQGDLPLVVSHPADRVASREVVVDRRRAPGLVGEQPDEPSRQQDLAPEAVEPRHRVGEEDVERDGRIAAGRVEEVGDVVDVHPAGERDGDDDEAEEELRPDEKQPADGAQDLHQPVEEAAEEEREPCRRDEQHAGQQQRTRGQHQRRQRRRQQHLHRIAQRHEDRDRDEGETRGVAAVVVAILRREELDQRQRRGHQLPRHALDDPSGDRRGDPQHQRQRDRNHRSDVDPERPEAGVEARGRKGHGDRHEQPVDEQQDGEIADEQPDPAPAPVASPRRGAGASGRARGRRGRASPASTAPAGVRRSRRRPAAPPAGG